MKYAIAIGRVSTKSQAENNHSLEAQRNSVDRMSVELDVEIIKRWEMAISSKKGKNLKRRDLNEAMELCKLNRNIKYILFDRVNRLGREVKYLTYYKLELEMKYGVQLVFCDPGQQRLNGVEPEAFAKFVEKLAEAEAENAEKGELNKARMLERYNQGYFPFPVKLGYKTSSTPGLHTPDYPTFEIIQQAMYKIIDRTHTAKEALKWATSKGLRTVQRKKLDMHRWIRLLKQPYYAGIIKVSDWEPRKGLHTAMITPDEFEELQYRVEGVKPKYQRMHHNPNLPLQKVISCGRCGGSRRISGSRTNNGHGGLFDRYFCMDCKLYQSKKSVHTGLEEMLEGVVISEEEQNNFTAALKEVWREKNGDREQAIRSLKQRREELGRTKSSLLKAYALNEGELQEDLKSEVELVQRQIRELDSEILGLESTDSEAEDFMNFSFNYVGNLSRNWWDLQKEDMIWCQKILFPGEIILYENGVFGTKEISPIYRLIHTLKQELVDSEVNRGSMVELPGIAPGSEK